MTSKILIAIEEELVRLRQIRDLLAGDASDGSVAPPAAAGTKKTRNLSDDARQRIADAQKRRWAAQRLSS